MLFMDELCYTYSYLGCLEDRKKPDRHLVHRVGTLALLSVSAHVCCVCFRVLRSSCPCDIDVLKQIDTTTANETTLICNLVCRRGI